MGGYLLPARIGSFSGCNGRFFQKVTDGVERSQLEGGVCAPGIHPAATILGTHRHRQMKQPGLVAFQHSPVSFKSAFQEGEGSFCQNFFLSAEAVMEPGELGHPGSAGMVNGAGPESANHFAAVVHGMRKH